MSHENIVRLLDEISQLSPDRKILLWKWMLNMIVQDKLEEVRV